ncbi:Hydroxymethylglutaryl-CoA synthase, mitochondrial [Schistosoma haematobium]|uniref:Hydroxymethylglutaryl-CoA synthase n=1 Tax=Schistosoma haematobium TaxID=6185 RepID=A0A922LMR9_SCHHA|nr:Hydroxymethylglutaryl-CoA synthase, mitochondrial [Schistosoma haematobium]KAH9589991.1 Hydroxymethylglutaryl-CoA synthase, mitochondrial [Schistosoma haematobium]
MKKSDKFRDSQTNNVSAKSYCVGRKYLVMSNSDFGIIALEIYFPKFYVSQHDLEVEDKCVGKYTQGLGQTSLGFCSIQEDINSMCLTVVSNLIRRTNLDLKTIGFLEVGTETIIDKSKSTKTVLMQLFETAGNFDVEGTDTKNACFGGTSALFGALNWLESSYCNGRMALVVAADIAVYGDKSARPTGGAGAVAILLGPNAPLVIDFGLRAVYMKHCYDFYKPNLSSEYPIVDGHFSMQCYREALEMCYKLYRHKSASKGLNSIITTPWRDTLPKVNNAIDYMCLHAPFTRLVQKAIGWLAMIDMRTEGIIADTLNDSDVFLSSSKAGQLCHNNHQMTSKSEYFDQIDPSIFNALKDYRLLDDKHIPDHQLDTICLKATESLYRRKVDPGLMFVKNIGNMYTASLYACLVSLLLNTSKAELLGRRILMYSYGSGMASAMYSILIHPDRDLSTILNCSLESSNGLSHIHKRLFDERTQVTVSQFELMLKERELSHNSGKYFLYTCNIIIILTQVVINICRIIIKSLT